MMSTLLKKNNRLWAIFTCVVVMLFNTAAIGQDTPDEDAVDNIVVILDASGSMAEMMPGSNKRKMEVAKEALLNVMEQVEPKTHVGLLVFSGNNKKSDWVYPLGPLDKSTFSKDLMRLGPDGGTPLGEYIRIGADRLLEKRTEQHGYGTYRLLIVTDGQASDSGKVQQFTPDALSRGIVIDVIGVAMDGDHALATRVHNYRRANDAEALREAIMESVAEIGSAVDDTATDDESFELIAALPDNMAEGLLTALTTSNNEPIKSSKAWTNPTATSNTHNTNHAAATHTTTTNHSSGGGTSAGSWFFAIIIWVVVLMVALKIFVAIVRKASS